MNTRKARISYSDWSVLAWMQPGETYAQARARLDKLWESGLHPSQIEQQLHLDQRRERFFGK